VDFCFPPQLVLKQPANDVVQYFKQLQQKPTTNQVSKVMVVGQEGVGKSTLVKSAGTSSVVSFLINTVPPAKTDGIEIST